VVRNRVDPFFLEAPAEAELSETAERFALDGRRYVLHVGNSLPYKNIDRLLRALGEIARIDGKQPLLVKVGAALSAKQLRLAAAEQVRVRCLGEVPPRELRALYHLADCLAYPSLYEGFGWPVAEALACGLPVVAGKIGALPEIAEETALLVDPENTAEIASAIRRVSEDRDLREELAARGKARGAHLARGDVGPEMLEIYREAIGLRE
jgi:glycosyltransferase involved in cell wall biosynthesis